MQWFWATWEASQFCILTRLKTPLGKPQETFMSIEAVLKSYAIDADNQHGEDEGGDTKRSMRNNDLMFSICLAAHTLMCTYVARRTKGPLSNEIGLALIMWL